MRPIIEGCPLKVAPPYIIYFWLMCDKGKEEEERCMNKILIFKFGFSAVRMVSRTSGINFSIRIATICCLWAIPVLLQLVFMEVRLYLMYRQPI